jgi:hypothetical protein
MHKYALILLLAGVSVLCAQLSPLPITEYDYRTPVNAVSPIAVGMGGLNLTYPADYYSSYDNPALLASSPATALAMSYRLKNEEQYSFLEAMQISNALKDKQVKYFTLITKGAAVTYQPMASIHLSQWTGNSDISEYYDYQLDKWQASFAAKDPDRQMLSAGLNVKYLTGRLVYLREKKVGINLIREAFIDDKIKGFSTDLGFTVEQGDFTWGGVVYDLFSRLYWENYDSVQIQRRSALGMEYHNGDLSLLAGIHSKIDKEPDPTIHFGLVQDWNWSSSSYGDRETTQNIILRMGMYSKDFYGTDNINYTLGTGYYYNLFRFDFALVNQGMRLRDSEFLFSIGVGIQ